ncbi:MAG: hypothetical protein NTW11_02960 [Candidatus Staskawiczbacteria bacterium]|nr:hypothetical protein [Candidatus Staskawiczbacteria bacterium]
MSIKKTIITAIVGLTLVAVVAPGVAQGVTIDELMAQIATLQAQLTTLSGTPAASGTGACAGVAFARNLTVGATGSDVKCLQSILNTKGFTVSATGAGSPGNETTYFGAKTLVAVKLYQVAQGFTPANQVGPMTRARLNASLGSVTPGQPPVVTPTGSISATVAASSPAASGLIAGQAQAGLLDINFTGSGVVTTVTLQRSGISDQNTLSNIYLFDGATRITDGYSFNVNGSTVINGLSINVNGSKTISVRADVSAAATSTDTGSSIAVALTAFNGGTASVQGSTMALVTGTAATVYFAANTMDTTDPTYVNAGTTQNVFWTNQITVNTRAVLLKTANFRMVGSAPADALGNIKLFIDGVDTGKIATVGSITGSNYAMFDLASAPITLTTGTHTVDVRADVQKGTNRTLQLSVQQASDLTITDPQVGVNIAANGATSGSAFTARSGTTFTIKWGTTTTTVESAFNALSNVTSGATNATIGKFTVHAYGEDVKVSSLAVTPLIKSAVATSCSTDANGANATTCGLNNVTLYFNGSQIGSAHNWTVAEMLAGTTITYTLGSQMIIPAGQDSTIEVKADLTTIAGAAYTSGTILTTLVGDADNAYGQTSQYTVGVPQTSSIATNGLAISSATLVVSKNTALASYTAAPNTTNVKIGSFTLQNQSTSEGVRLTTLTVALTSNGSAALNTSNGTSYTGLSALRTSDTTGSGSTPIQPAASNVFSVGDVLAPNGTMTIDIYANVGSSTLLSAVVTRLTVASIGVSSNIAAAGDIATGQTVTFTGGTIASPTKVTSGTTAAQYVVGGTTGASQTTFNFISSSGASTISELRFVVTGSDANPTQTVTNVCVGTVCGQPISNEVKLTNLALAVPNGGNGLSQPVTISYATVGTGGVVPTSTALVSLSYVKYTSGGVTKTRCTTAESASCDASIAANVDGNTMTLVGGKPTVVVAAGGNTIAPINQSIKVGQATVTATGGSIKVRAIAFNVVWSGANTLPNTTSAQSLTDSNGNTLTDFTCTSTAVSASVGTHTVTCTTAATYAADFPISVGGSQEFDLYVTPANMANTTGIPKVSSSLSKADFLWDDTSDNNVTAAASGRTGTLINGFPTNSYTY